MCYLAVCWQSECFGLALMVRGLGWESSAWIEDFTRVIGPYTGGMRISTRARWGMMVSFTGMRELPFQCVPAVNPRVALRRHLPQICIFLKVAGSGMIWRLKWASCGISGNHIVV